MSSRKATKQGAIKASCKEEGLEKWYNHFNKLIRRALVLEDNIQQMTYQQSLPDFHSSLKWSTIFGLVEKQVFTIKQAAVKLLSKA